MNTCTSLKLYTNKSGKHFNIVQSRVNKNTTIKIVGGNEFMICGEITLSAYCKNEEQ